MKILHICLGCFYIDNYSYQENLLPKYHKKLGFDVQIMASTLSFDKNGKACNVKSGEFLNENNIKVKRLDYKKFIPKNIGKFLRIYDDVEKTINNYKPDILFIHGCQFLDIFKIVRYVKKHNIKVYVDNHADFSNSARNFFSKNIMHKIVWKGCAKLIEPYTTKFYGVLPARVDFLKNVYQINPNKVELLVMGVDDEMVDMYLSDEIKNKTRQKYNIKTSDFLIITGGKIDKSKKQVINLLKIINELYSRKVKVLVYGSIIEEMKDEVFKYVNNDSIQYIGWLSNDETAKIIASSDLAVYPGRHSVLWEETVGFGIPMIVKKWEGTTHVDVGGNTIFLQDDTIDELKDKIDKALNKVEYTKMKDIATKKGMKEFSYLEIAKRSIDYENE